MESNPCYAMPSSLHKVKIEYQAVTIKVLLFGTIALIQVTILLKKKTKRMDFLKSTNT